MESLQRGTRKGGNVIAVILETNGVTKDFVGLRALDRVDIEVQEGEIFGLIGPNGSGKTTLLNVITGFLPSTAGTILYKRRSISGLPSHAIAAQGVVRTFQITSIFSNLTVGENIITGSYLKTDGTLLGSLFQTRAYRQEEKRLKEKAAEVLDLLGMRRKMGVPSKALGLGEQRRIEIGIGLAANPSLLMLDEPAAGLNPTEAEELVRLIQTIRKMGVTLIVVEHNMRLIMSVCTRIAVLDHGLKIAEGAPEEIAENKQVIAVYLGKKR